jgi:polyribonucleotide nucleotidyltransferase
VTAFGAFIEIMPGTEALLHVSEMRHTRVENPEDVVKKGEHVKVKLIDRDERGRLRLSIKAMLPKPEGTPEGEPAGVGAGESGGERPRSDRPRGDRPRGGGRGGRGRG